MTHSVSRRDFLGSAGAIAAGASAPSILRGGEGLPTVKILETGTITRQPTLYHGWPTLTRRRNGQLMVVWSGGREAHVCPFGRVETMHSDNEGKSWTWPRILLDGAIDDRDSGVLETEKGTLLVTTFTSLAFEAALSAAESGKTKWPADKLERWKCARDRLGADERKKELGVWMMRSTDGGKNWSSRYRVPVNSPHGPIQLRDGRLLYPGKELWHGKKRIGVCASTDDGESWKWLKDIPTRDGDKHENYHELHGVETTKGTILVHVRNHNAKNNREILQSESRDGGKSWMKPHAIGVWGLPSHLLRLKDGRVLMTYGYRRAPFGNQARITANEGKNWSAPLTISNDGKGGDLGYPSTVELKNGSLLTVWYEVTKKSPFAVLRQAVWELKG